MEKVTTSNASKSFNFDTEINENGGAISLQFNVNFTADLKLNDEAPQKWSVLLPSADWTAKESRGDLTTPISVSVPKGNESREFNVVLDLVTCRDTECIPKKIVATIKVEQRANAPNAVVLIKDLTVD